MITFIALLANASLAKGILEAEISKNGLEKAIF